MIGLRLDSEARLRGGAAACGAARSAAGAQREVLGLRGVVHVVGGPDVLHGRVLAALLRPEERVLQHPARAAGQAVGCAACESHGQPCRCRCANSRRGSHRSSNLSRRGCEGCCSFCQAPQVPEGPAHARLRRQPLVQEALYVVLRSAAAAAAAALGGVRTYSAASWGSWERKARTAASPAAPVMEGGPCGSAEAFLWNRPQRRVLQRLRVGVLAGLHEIVQVEVARDERGGLAVRLVQGQRLVPLQVARNLLEARALIEAVGPKRLHLFMGYCAATSPAARSTLLRSARA